MCECCTMFGMNEKLNPDLVAEIKVIVDFLQPMVSPYESDIYWFMFRHSFIETGREHVRVSSTRLAEGIGKKFKNSPKPYRAADKTISENLRELSSIGAITRVGEPDRGGTLYSVTLPSLIPAIAERLAAPPRTLEAVLTEDIDYYNVKANRLLIFDRDRYVCYKCGKLLTLATATLDHTQPVSRGGKHSADNLVTCCLMCNSKRQNASMSDFLSSS